MREITRVPFSEAKRIQTEVGLLDHICVCKNCRRVLQFSERDIDRRQMTPKVVCNCGARVQLHAKYLIPRIKSVQL